MKESKRKLTGNLHWKFDSPETGKKLIISINNIFLHYLLYKNNNYF